MWIVWAGVRWWWWCQGSPQKDTLVRTHNCCLMAGWWTFKCLHHMCHKRQCSVFSSSVSCTCSNNCWYTQFALQPTDVFFVCWHKHGWWTPRKLGGGSPRGSVALPRAQRDHSIPTVHQLHSHTLRLCPEKWLFWIFTHPYSAVASQQVLYKIDSTYGDHLLSPHWSFTLNEWSLDFVSISA